MRKRHWSSCKILILDRFIENIAILSRYFYTDSLMPFITVLFLYIFYQLTTTALVLMGFYYLYRPGYILKCFSDKLIVYTRWYFLKVYIQNCTLQLIFVTILSLDDSQNAQQEDLFYFFCTLYAVIGKCLQPCKYKVYPKYIAKH